MATNCQLTSSSVHHLIDINGVAELLGMTRQGAYKLIERDETFPDPEVEVTAGRIWSTHAVEKWMLKPGNRRFANFLDANDELERFALVVAARRVELIIPADAFERLPGIAWAKSVGRFENADRINVARQYVPLKEWDKHVTPAGRPKARSR